MGLSHAIMSPYIMIRRRVQIFYLLVVLFFIIGTLVVLYAQGWRFDIETRTINKVGGIFIRSFPDDANILLNNKPIKNESAFLSKGTFISSLSPKTYRVELGEPGYDQWRESVTVSPSLVVELRYAVLIPQNATTVAAGLVQNFSVANDILTVQGHDGSIVSNGASIGKGILVDESVDGDSVIIKNQTNGKYLLYQLQNSSTTDLTAILIKDGAIKSDISNISFDPYDPNTIIAGGSSKIWLINIAGAKATRIEKAPTGETLGNSTMGGSSLVAWTESKKAETSSTIAIYDESSGEITASSSIYGKNSELKWVKDNLLGILQNDGELYLYDVQAKTIEKIADDVKYFSPTNNGSSIAALENRSMEIIPLNDVSEDYYRFNLPDITNVQRVSWYKDSTHLFIEYGDHVAFLDLKDAGLNNFTTVSAGTAPFYDADKNALYIINQSGNIIKFDFPS